MASVYVNGQVLGATGFPSGNSGLHCEWQLVSGTNWQKIQGLDKVRALSSTGPSLPSQRSRCAVARGPPAAAPARPETQQAGGRNKS